MIRVLFFATPDSAIPLLQEILDASALEVIGLVTQPPRPHGRRLQVQKSKLITYAEEKRLPVYTYASLRSEDATRSLKALHPDVCLLYAYGNILPDDILHLAPHGVVNVHPSLLPHHRGASPLQTAIAHGDATTGVSFILLDSGIDTGPILFQKEMKILPNDTQQTLGERLMKTAAENVISVLMSYVQGELQPSAQPPTPEPLTKQLRREDGALDFSLPAEVLERRIRAFAGWPGTFAMWNGVRVAIHAVQLIAQQDQDTPSGTVFCSPAGYPAVTTSTRALELRTVQIAGKQPTDGRSFLNGHAGLAGSRLTG